MRLIYIKFLFLFSFFCSAADDYEQALVAYEKNEIDTAYIHLKNALQNNDNVLSAKILMGKVLLNKAYYNDGISIFEEALAEGADLNLFLGDYANALMVVKKYQEVIELAKKTNLSQANKIKAGLLVGNAYALMENVEKARQAYQATFSLAPNNINILMAFSSFETSQKQFDNAERLAKKAIALNSNDRRVWYLQGQIYLQQGKIEQAIESFEQGYRLDNNDPLLQRALAQAYTTSQQYDKGLELVETILTKTPDDAFVKLLKSQLLSYTNNDDAAKELLNEISEKLSLLTDKERASNSFLSYVAGTAAYLQNNDEVALIELQGYLTTKPNDVTTISMLVNIYLRQQKIDKAQVLLEVKENTVLEHLSLSLTLFDIYLQRKKYYAADILLKSLEEKYSNNTKLLFAKTKYHTSIGQFEQALSLLERYKPVGFNSAYLLNKGLIYLAQADYDKASAITKRLVEELPGSPNVLAFQGSLYIKTQQWQNAIDTFKQLLAIHPTDFASRFNVATAQAALGELEQASDVAERLFEQFPDNIPVKLLIAKIARDTKKLDKAEKLLKDVLIVDSTNISALEAIIALYIQQKNFHDALRASDQLTKLVFLKPSYIKQKAEIYIALNDLEQAKKQLGILLGVSESAQQLYELSLLQIKVKDYSSAKKSLQSALIKTPKHVLLTLTLIRVEALLNNTQQANKLLASITDQNTPDVLTVKGELLLKQGKSSLAQKQFLAALKLDAGATLALLKSYDLAIKGVLSTQFESTVSQILLTSPNLYLMRNLLADYYLTQQNNTKAILHYQMLVDAPGFKDKAFVYNNLANIYLGDDNLKAEVYSAKAYELNNAAAEIIDTYGWVMALNQKYEQALVLLRQAYSMNSVIPDVQYHIAYTLNALNRKAQAKSTLERLLAQPVTFSEKEKAQQLLKTLKNK